jgi:hypothetical protein
MTEISSRALRGRAAYPWLAAAGSAAAVIALVIATQATAGAAVEPVLLGTAGNYAVLGGSDVTNTGPTLISGGNLGVSPGTSVTGITAANFAPPAQEDLPDSAGAQADLSTAYTQAMNETPATAIPLDTIVGPATFTPGIYAASSSLLVNGGPIILNGEHLADPVFVFQVPSALTVGSVDATRFVLINGASACEVFWQVGSSATIDSGSEFVGNILASASISVLSAATINGRVLASTGGVSLIDDAINAPTGCTETSPTMSPSPSMSPTISPSMSISPTMSPTMSISPTMSPTMSISPTMSPTMSISPTMSPTMSISPTMSPTMSISPTPSPTPTRVKQHHHHKRHHKHPRKAPVPTPVPTTLPVTG